MYTSLWLQPIALEHPATLVYAYVTMATANNIGALGHVINMQPL